MSSNSSDPWPVLIEPAWVLVGTRVYLARLNGRAVALLVERAFVDRAEDLVNRHPPIALLAQDQLHGLVQRQSLRRRSVRRLLIVGKHRSGASNQPFELGTTVIQFGELLLCLRQRAFYRGPGLLEDLDQARGCLAGHCSESPWADCRMGRGRSAYPGGSTDCRGVQATARGRLPRTRFANGSRPYAASNSSSNSASVPTGSESSFQATRRLSCAAICHR